MKIRTALTLLIALPSFHVHANYPKEFTFSKSATQFRIKIKEESNKIDYEKNKILLESFLSQELTLLKISYDEIGKHSEAYKNEYCLKGTISNDEIAEYIIKNIKYEDYEYEDYIKARNETILKTDKEMFENLGFDCRSYWKKDLDI